MESLSGSADEQVRGRGGCCVGGISVSWKGVYVIRLRFKYYHIIIGYCKSLIANHHTTRGGEGERSRKDGED